MTHALLRPLQEHAGACGCGVPDEDTDGDGAADCIDECPADPYKKEPGECGCGTTDYDGDRDGTSCCPRPIRSSLLPCFPGGPRRNGQCLGAVHLVWTAAA